MAHQVFRHYPTEHGEVVPGLPAGAITDEWLADAAARRRVSVEDLSAEIAAYRRADGQPLYRATAKGKDELGEAVQAPAPLAKPKVPLGQAHPQAGE